MTSLAGRVESSSGAADALGRREWRRRLVRRVVGKVFLYLTLVLLTAIFLLPLVWMVSTSLKPEDKVFEYPPRLFTNFQWWNYTDAFEQFPFWQSLKNTMVITTFAMLGRLLSASFTAWVLARLRFPGRNAVFVLVLSTMMIPYQVTLIPQYIMFTKIGWSDSFKPLIVPNFFGGGAFAIFLLRQFMMTIPREYDDAAYIDGCGFFGVFWRIILPLSLPGLATLAIFTFMGNWNDFLGPLIYLSSPDKRTLAIAIRQWQVLKITASAAWVPALWSHLLAMSSLLVLPPTLLYFFAQRYFIQGIVISGIKG